MKPTEIKNIVAGEGGKRTRETDDYLINFFSYFFTNFKDCRY
jgi:hypothetical protein